MSFLINPYISFPTGGGGSTLTDGIVNYYKLDGNSDDAVGSLDGSDTAVVYNIANGVVLSGGSFNGSSSISTMGANWIDSLTAVTISCWVKVNYGSAYDSIVTQYATGASGKWFGINTSNSNGTIQFAVDAGGDGGAARQFVQASASDGDWHHVVGVRDTASSELRIYVDYDAATATTSSVYAGVLACGGSGASLGKINSGGSYYDGDLDEVGIWNRALTTAEIEELYNSGSGNQYPFTLPECSQQTIDTTGLAAYYNFNSDALDPVNGYDMTNTNVAFTSTGAKYDEAGIFLTGSTDPTSSATRLLYTSSDIITNTDSNNVDGWSVSTWIKFDSLPTTSESYVVWLNSDLDRFIQLKYVASTGVWRFVIYNGTAYNFEWSTTPATDTWIHVSITMAPSTGTFNVYFDGTSQISGTDTHDNYSLTPYFCIGNHYSASRSFLGWMDDFSFWNRELSSAEVTTLVNSTCPLLP